MKLDIKGILWFLIMGLFYMGIGVLGHWFSPVYIFAFFLGVPFSIYIYKKGIEFSSFLMPIIVIFFLSFMGIQRGAMMIFFLLFIPSFICGIHYYYKKNLPRNIIMLSIGYLFGWICVLILWNFLYHIEVIPQFFALTQEIENLYLRELSYLHEIALGNIKDGGKVALSILGQNPKTFIEGYPFYRLAIKQSIYLMQYLFPVFIFIFGFLSSIIQVLLTKLILKALNWKAPSLKEIGNIGFTPLTVGLLGLTWILRSGMDERAIPVLTMVVDNVLVIFSLFMFLIGILFTIYIIKNSKTGVGLKILVSILSVFSMILSPFLFVILGLFEAIFNFRKTERFL